MDAESGPDDLLITTASLPEGTDGVPYSSTLSANGGRPPYTWSATGLPEGLSISDSGQISGTPTTPGTYTVTLTIRDFFQRAFFKNFTFIINPQHNNGSGGSGSSGVGSYSPPDPVEEAVKNAIREGREILKYVESLNIKKYYILGGPGAVSDGVKKKIK